MANDNFWDWDNGDERRVSAVYQDAAQNDTAQNMETQNEEPQNIESQNEESQYIEPQKEESQNIESLNEESQNEESQYHAAQDLENDFILVDTPQNHAPQKDTVYVQAEYQQNEHQQNNFRQIIPLPDIQQDQGAKDQKADFSHKDISENKAAAMAAYLLGPVGIIIALLAARDSAYTAFHVRQALKITICSAVLEIAAAVLALFGMIPLVGIIFKLVFIIICFVWLGVLVLRLTAVAQVCDGEAREPAVIGKMNCFR